MNTGAVIASAIDKLAERERRTIAQAMPPAGMGGGPAAAAGEGVKLGVPSPAGPLGSAGGMKMHTDKEGGGSSDKPDPSPPQRSRQS